MFLVRPIFILLMLCFLSAVNARLSWAEEAPDIRATLLDSPSGIGQRVTDYYKFFGLAFYYDNVSYYVADEDGLYKISVDDEFELLENQWFAAVGRFQVLVIQKKGLLGRLNGSVLTIKNSIILNNPEAVVEVVSKQDLASMGPVLDSLRYAHLWRPLAWIAKVVEASLVAIQSNIVNSWGLTVVVFSLLLKLILLPVGVMTTRFQRRVSQIQAQLAPKLAEIKANFDGEEAHNRLMAAHKGLGVSPFYSLTPMLGSFIQIPILIAVFNALGEMPQFVGQPFLWIGDLAYPDVVGYLPLPIPMFGNTISLMPFIMTAVTLYSTIIFRNRHALKVEVLRHKRNLYFMAALFFILFYPFPAVMVLYWTLANILQTIQQQMIKL